VTFVRCTECCVEGCERPARYYDLCFKHLKTHRPNVPARAEVTAELLRQMVRYDPDTGIFTWAVPRKAMKAGDRAGSEVGRYVRISLFDRPHSAHRLAFLYMTGAWPDRAVDHINGDKHDNRWCNLRHADATINAQNVRKPSKRSRLGLLGVSPPQRGRTQFKASIQVDGKSVHLGYHDTAEEAHEAYLKAKRSLHAGATI
jgi:hypothetical protein